MTTVLLVKANNRPADQAVSVKLYEAFLESYNESHPNDTVVELDLYNEDLPYVGVDMINGTFKASRELDLTEKEAKAVAVADKHLNIRQYQDFYRCCTTFLFAYLANFWGKNPIAASFLFSIY